MAARIEEAKSYVGELHNVRVQPIYEIKIK